MYLPIFYKIETELQVKLFIYAGAVVLGTW